MKKKKQLTPEQQLQESLTQLKNYRPLDDDFMRELFRNNWALAELVLRIITGIKDLTLIQQETQYDLKRLVGAKSICLDVFGKDNQQKLYDLEIQRADEGAVPERARYHSSAMDIEFLSEGQKFTELPTTYTIFITENDIYGAGKPVYHIRRMVTDFQNRPFADRSYILYVNGAYVGDDDIGKLMHDFRCTNADDMNFELMAQATRYYKNTPEGVSYMCEVMEKRIKENVEIAEYNQAVQMALEMLADGTIPIEKIARFSHLSLEEVQQLAKEQKNNN